MNKINDIYTGADGRQSLYDLTVPENWNGIVIIFIHGYMGFKDWGCWSLVQQYFTNRSYGFLKYNVSHNGCSTNAPEDFTNLDAFAKNTYSKELQDLECIIKRLMSDLPSAKVYLIGHSRGGGIAALQSGHIAVQKWASWAGIASIADRFPSGKELEQWRLEGVRFVTNGRTKQEMPHDFIQYEDFIANHERLNIQMHCKKNTKPNLILHGQDDTSVHPDEGEKLARWTDTDLCIISNAQHTFNASHPWREKSMPKELEQACKQTLLFFES